LIQFGIRPVLDWMRHENHRGIKAKRLALGRSRINEFRRRDTDCWNAAGL
jgi:hypothetical protein